MREVSVALRGLTRAPGGLRLAADRLDLPKETQAGLAPGAVGRRPARSRRSCSRRATGSSATRSPESLRTRSSRAARRARPGALRLRAAPARAGAPARARRAGRGARAAPGRARRARRPRANRRGDGQGAPLPPARAAAPPRARDRGSRQDEGAAGEQLARIRETAATTSRSRGYNFRAAEHRSPVAQLAEHPAVNRRVVGSSPTRGATESPAQAGFFVGGTGDAGDQCQASVPRDWCADRVHLGSSSRPGK